MTLRNRFQNRVRLGVTNRNVTHVTTDAAFSNGSLVPFSRSRVEFRCQATCHIFRGEQFRGRAVRASRDSLDPGRPLICTELSRQTIESLEHLCRFHK